MLDVVYYGWPYLGLVLAGVVVLLLVRERPGPGHTRFTDPAWAFGWVGPVYLLHQSVRGARHRPARASLRLAIGWWLGPRASATAVPMDGAIR